MAAGEMPATGTSRPALVLLAALAVYLALAFGVFAAAWRDPFTLGIGVRGDPSQVMWFLSWIPFAVSHGTNPLFSAYIDHPSGVNLMWNTSVPLVGLLLWPVTSTLGPLVAYNLAETLGLALSAWCALLLLRRVVHSRVAAGFGGLLYGFSPYMLAQSLGHAHVTIAFLPPLILVLLDEVVRVQRWRPVIVGAALGVAGAAQLLISEEVLVITGLLAIVLLVLAAALWPQEAQARARRALPALAVAVAVFTVLVAVPVGFQLLGPQHISGRAHEQNVYVNDLLGFWVPSEVQWLAPDRLLRISARFTGNSSEWDSYIGVPMTLLLGFVPLRHWRNGWVRLAALAGVIVAVLSLGITVHLGGRVFEHVPVFVLVLPVLLLPRFGAARAVVLVTFAAWLALTAAPLLDNVVSARLMLVVYLLAGLLLAVFVDSLYSHGRGRVAGGMALVALALAPMVPRLPYPTSVFSDPAFFARGGLVSRVPEGSVALVAPITTYDDVDAMRWQAISGMRFRMPEGYAFVPAPPPAGNQLNTPASITTQALIDARLGRSPGEGDDRLRDAMRAELATWRVATVIIGPMPNQDAAVALMTWVIGRPPEVTGGVLVWWDVDTGRSAAVERLTGPGDQRSDAATRANPWLPSSSAL